MVFLYGAELDQVVDSRHEAGGSYEIRVRGRLDDETATALDGLTTALEPSATVLSGELRDDAELRELLERLEALGLEPVDVRRTPS